VVVNKSQVAEAVGRDTPWWRDPNWAVIDRDLREADASQLSYYPSALDDIRIGGLYMLYGPRRVGKSVLVKRTVQALLDQGVNPRQIIRVTVDVRFPIFSGHLLSQHRLLVERMSPWEQQGVNLPLSSRLKQLIEL
jgi:hypothetical protein